MAEEKTSVVQKESAELSPSKVDALPEIGSAERLAAEQRLVRKLDTRLLPTIFLIFIMNYIDVRNRVHR
jgi:proteasome assembly chaperone (PAC2) family protein